MCIVHLAMCIAVYRWLCIVFIVCMGNIGTRYVVRKTMYAKNSSNNIVIVVNNKTNYFTSKTIQKNF